MSCPEPNRLNRRADADTAQTVFVSAQLLALNAALGGDGTELAGPLLAELARELRKQPPARSPQSETFQTR